MTNQKVADDNFRWAPAGPDSVGVVVATTWMLCKPRQFRKHARLYASCNWDSLTAHPKLFSLWIPSMARASAVRILDKLLQEVQGRPRPLVFATFSGGLKTCLYKIFEILDGSYAGVDSTLKKYRIIRDCYAGQIHDSSPIDFVSRNGANFITHPTTLGTRQRIEALTWSAQLVGRALDAVFQPSLKVQRHAMWTSAEIAAGWGPVLFFCSKDDELAPFEVIQDFSSRLSDLGCQVRLVSWDESTHIAHLLRHPEDYSNEVVEFLSKAAASFPSRVPHESSHPLVTNGPDLICRSPTARQDNSGRSLALPGGCRTSPRLKHWAYGTKNDWIPSRL